LLSNFFEQAIFLNRLIFYCSYPLLAVKERFI